jgi:GH24 family phage-related lysozyme (muramidase)
MIVGFEVGSKSQYERMYQHPEWPGGKSGVTVAIGYDLGYTTREHVQSDFGALVPGAVVIAMQNVVGLTGAAAHQALAGVKNKVVIPWDAAMKVFEKDFTRYENEFVRACPRAVELNGDCFGAIASIVYNRGGGGFTSSGDRYSEMRLIRAAIASGDLKSIPGYIRKMKRLWPNVGGLLKRRDDEAKLFEAGLQKPSPLPDFLNTSRGNPAPAEVNVQPTTTPYEVSVEMVQRHLVTMNYHEVGDIDGKFGGKTRGAITAFMADRGQNPGNGAITPAVVAEINDAVNEGWSRPIKPERANATASDLANKLPTVNQTWWQKLWAYFLGVPSAAAGVFKFVFGDQSAPSDYLEPVKNFFASIPPELYFVVVAGIALAIFLQAKKVQDTTVKAYQRGEIN